MSREYILWIATVAYGLHMLEDQAIADDLAAVTTKHIKGLFTQCCCYVPSN